MEKRHFYLAKILHDNGIIINHQNSEFSTQLHEAIKNNNITLINYLLTSGCSVDNCDDNGQTPLHLAFMEKDSKTIKWLLDNSEKRKSLSKNAYYTMVDEWNAAKAAVKFSKIAECVLNGEKADKVFEFGVCSKAEILKDE